MKEKVRVWDYIENFDEDHEFHYRRFDPKQLLEFDGFEHQYDRTYEHKPTGIIFEFSKTNRFSMHKLSINTFIYEKHPAPIVLNDFIVLMKLVNFPLYERAEK